MPVYEGSKNPKNEQAETAKGRVEIELEELKEKIVKLSAFLYSKQVIEANLSQAMLCCMRDQLRAMEEYASRLQQRLVIWDKTDKELEHRVW